MTFTYRTGLRACQPGCPGNHARFDLDHGDRARRDYTEALSIAVARAPSRGRQMVRKHYGMIFKRGIWMVQDVRPS